MTLKKMGTEAVVHHIAELLKAAGGRALLVALPTGHRPKLKHVLPREAEGRL